jgi:hypothetical protein
MNPDYGNQNYRNHQVNLTLNPTLSDSTSTVLTDGATVARIDYGWQTNGAGNKYSNWYGFGLVDAKAAVTMAKAYTSYKLTQLVIPTWKEDAIADGQVKYGEVKELGKFSVASEKAIDMIQLAFQASEKTAPEISNVCMGSVGIFLKSPQGSVSVLSTPYNVFYDNTHTKDTRDGGKIGPDSIYVLGSYAFYGENPKGDWTVYAVSGTPLTTSGCAANPKLDVAYRIYNAE